MNNLKRAINISKNFSTKKIFQKPKTEINTIEEVINIKDFQNIKDIPNNPIKNEYENYVCLYYKLFLHLDFDLFNLRNILYSYIFVKQRKGKLYLNICDSFYRHSSEEKNLKVQSFLKTLDWLNIDLDFDKKFQSKIFETQKLKDYENWIKYLIDNRDAYKCFCKNHQKCEKNCSSSYHNQSNNIDNNEFSYIRFKNNNKNYSYYDYINAVDVNFNSDELGDFILYKNFNKQFTESYKRVVDDEIFQVTHVIDNKKNLNAKKNAMITKALMLNAKKYIELPEVKLHYMEKEYDNINIDYLKSRFLMPETIINEAYLLGSSKGPEKEYKELIINNKDKDVINLDKVIYEFDIAKVNKIGSIFDMRRLLYLNKRLLIKKFIHNDKIFLPQRIEEIRNLMIKVFPKYINKINNFQDEQWKELFEIIIPNLETFEDIYKYYFLFELPVISNNSKLNEKVIKKFLLDIEYKEKLFKDLNSFFSGLNEFDSKSINREISYFIFNQYQLDQNINNANLYPLLKLILTGNSEISGLGEICQFIGKKEVVNRVKRANSITKEKILENERIIYNKKENSIKLLSQMNNEIVKV